MKTPISRWQNFGPHWTGNLVGMQIASSEKPGGVHLHMKGRRLCTEDWREFEARFQAQGRFVTDKRENEEWEIIFSKLPPTGRTRS